MKTTKRYAAKGGHLIKTLFAAVLAATLLSSCLKNNNDNEVVGSSALTVINAWAADSTAVDYYLDRGSRINAQPILFSQRLPYFEIFSGQRLSSAVLSGTNVIIQEDQHVYNEGAFYSLFLTGTSDTAEFVQVEDNLTAPEAGKAKVRFAHMGPDAPAIDVAVKGGDVLFSNQAFKSTSPFSTVNPGSYTLEVRLAGTGTVVLEVPPISFGADSIYTVMARGLVNGTGSLALGAQLIRN